MAVPEVSGDHLQSSPNGLGDQGPPDQRAFTWSIDRPGRGLRSHRRGQEAVVDESLVAEAERTVPLGSSAEDPERTPGVDMDVWLLHVRYQASRQRDVLDRLVNEYLPYATSIARRLQRHGEAFEDLHQVALEALVAALQRFDCRRGIPFPAFATPTISGAVKRHYRDHGWSIRVPRSVHDVVVPARAATDALTVALGRTPSTAEVAREVGVAASTIEATAVATRARAVASLDRPFTEDGAPLLDSVGGPDAGLLLAENRVALGEAMAHLSDRDRTVVGLYFYEDLSQSQIAARYGVSQMQVSRWLAAILGRLRSHLGPR